jgi:hypothetical protein
MMLTPGIHTYALPDDVDCLYRVLRESVSAADSPDGMARFSPLQVLLYPELLALYAAAPDAAGPPTHWATDAADQLVLFPMPDQPYHVCGLYDRAPGSF